MKVLILLYVLVQGNIEGKFQYENETSDALIVPKFISSELIPEESMLMEKDIDGSNRNEKCINCRSDPLDPIYITPDNVDDVLQALVFPSMDALKERKRPFSFVVEGIVGTGKTTLLSAFKV